MCGIAGVISREPLGPEQHDWLSRMGQAMVHRGPDGAGEYRSAHVALGMRRLSIIDPATGWQPLYDEDESLALICNGEIYNYVELREQLVARGHRFRTGSDCETILHLYQEYGTDCLRHLRGMFAFALWDSSRDTLFLARDRMGEKPLYVHARDGMLLFGSELKTILRSGAVPFRLDPVAVDHYFHYYYVPEPRSAVEGIRKLPAGHFLTVSLDPWTVRESCYWRMEDAPPLEGDPARLIRAELETISEITIRADVPVGIALSGGLDSSALAVLTSRKYPGTMHAFSAGYEGRPRTDERSAAGALADHLGIPFHEVEIPTADVLERFPEVIAWQDDPLSDLSSFGYWMVAKAAHEAGVPVLLQGQGGDELFWGYSWVREAVRQSERKALMNGGPRLRDYLALQWPRLWPRRAPLDWLLSGAGLRSSWEEFRRDQSTARERLVFYELTQHFRTADEKLRDLYPPSLRERLCPSSSADLFTVPLPWPRIDIELTRLICQTYLLENGMARGDRLSMASSVELRLPLVDYRLVETVIGLRKTRSDTHLPPKAWLHEALADVLPEFVHKRPKRGFQPPTRRWHRALFERYGSLLEDGALVQLGVADPAAARDLRQGHYPLAEVESFAFCVLALETWCRQWVHVAVPAR